MTRVRTVKGDSEHFPIAMGLYQALPLSPSYLPWQWMYQSDTFYREVLWCMLFENDIVLIDKTRGGFNTSVEVWR